MDSEILLKKLKLHSRKRIAVSALTVAELEYGVSNSGQPERNRIALIKFISFFDVIPFDDADAVAYGKIKADLKKVGKLIGPIDMLLAGQAVSKKLVLVTNNIKEFERVNSLKIDDWTKE